MASNKTTCDKEVRTVSTERPSPSRRYASDPMFHHPGHHRTISSDGDISASSSIHSQLSPVPIDPPIHHLARDLPVPRVSRLHPRTLHPNGLPSRHPTDLPRPSRRSSPVLSHGNVPSSRTEENQLLGSGMPLQPQRTPEVLHPQPVAPRLPEQLPRPRSPLEPFVNDVFMSNYRNNMVEISTSTPTDDESVVATDDYGCSSWSGDESSRDVADLQDQVRRWSRRERSSTGRSSSGQGNDHDCEMNGVLGTIGRFFFGRISDRLPRNFVEETMICPIEPQMMVNPVVAPAGNPYGHESILKLIEESTESPHYFASGPTMHHPAYHRTVSSGGVIGTTSNMTQRPSSPMAVGPPIHPLARDIHVPRVYSTYPSTRRPSAPQPGHPQDLSRTRRSSLFNDPNEPSLVEGLLDPGMSDFQQIHGQYYPGNAPRYPTNLPRPRSPLEPFANDPFMFHYRNVVTADASGENESLVDPVEDDNFSLSSSSGEESNHSDTELTDDLRSSRSERTDTEASLPVQGDDQYCEMAGLLGAIKRFFFGTPIDRLPRNAIEEAMICPIQLQIMVDPVMAPDGYSYERRAILKWLSKKSISPMTREPVTTDQLIENRALKSVIQEYLISTRSIESKQSLVKEL